MFNNSTNLKDLTGIGTSIPAKIYFLATKNWKRYFGLIIKCNFFKNIKGFTQKIYICSEKTSIICHAKKCHTDELFVHRIHGYVISDMFENIQHNTSIDCYVNIISDKIKIII